jgi:hypothetical protein
MLKKTVCVILFIGFIVQPVVVNAGIPVSDLIGYAQRIKLLAKEIAKWVIYIKRFKEFTANLSNIKNNFQRTIRGFAEDELNKLIGDNIDMTIKIIESVAYEDKDKQDEWTEIFKDVKKLDIKYKNLKDSEYTTQNPLYKNPYIKTIIDDDINQRKENRTNILDTIQKLQLIRESEEEMVAKFVNYKKQIETLGGVGDGYISFSKITTLMNLMDLDILKLNTNIMALYRIMLENELKQMTVEEKERQKQGKEHQDEIMNIEKIKE